MPAPDVGERTHDITCAYGQEKIEVMRDWGRKALPANVQASFLSVLEDLERTLVRGWTEMDEACLHLSVSMAMLRRWRGMH
jgi:hypothetical protein